MAHSLNSFLPEERWQGLQFPSHPFAPSYSPGGQQHSASCRAGLAAGCPQVAHLRVHLLVSIAPCR